MGRLHMIVFRQIALHQFHDLTDNSFRILIFHEKEISAFSITDIRHLSFIDPVGIHDDTAGLSLSEDSRESYHRKCHWIDHIPENISGTYRRKLVNVSHHDKSHGRWYRFKKWVHQYNVYHGALIYDQHVTLKGTFFILLITLRRLKFKKPVNSLCLHPCGLGHPFWRTSCRRSKKDL